MSAWHRHIADILTVNDHTLAIGAQYTDGEKVINVGGDAIDVEQAPELIAAISKAVEILALA